ncbi:Zn-ribbon domain-containing OB-fold protein [Noviherbaspirillum pedocola]|uniref:OB-fold domain-containing protein n=1 Tax=Noviherbaspirillum pedocola TaxID=2801341 RepID=A0A934T486_9BURK|nr:OB-fold domain-containing protein [Noviherbaspirillum pedocola]MBK4739058.1 OB-fold domain-containing protein [Noviherbaspirillum pedocola]
MHTFYDQYDQEFLSFIARRELRIPRDVKTGKALGLHGRGWRIAREQTVEWVPASGEGTVASYVVFHRQYAERCPVPYTVVLVELPEGPRLLARLINAGPDCAATGMKVTACFDESGLAFQPSGP